MFAHTHLHARIQLTLAVWLLAAATSQAQVGLGLSPMREEFRAVPGQQISGTLNLSNDAPAKVRIRTQILDFNVDANATPQFQPNLGSEAATSCKSWLTVNPMETEAGANQQLPVRFTLRVPPEVAVGSYHCAAGFVTMPPLQPGVSAGGLRTAVRVVTAFYVVIGNPPRVGEVKSIAIERLHTKAGNNWQAVVVIANEGRMHLRPSGTLTLLDSTGNTIETDDFQSLPILPERDQRFLFPLKTDISRGGYTLRARVDIGTGEIQQAEAVLRGQ